MKTIIIDVVKKFFEEKYSYIVDEKDIHLIKTNKKMKGDLTLIMYPFLKIMNKDIKECEKEIGDYILKNVDFIESYNIY